MLHIIHVYYSEYRAHVKWCIWCYLIRGLIPIIILKKLEELCGRRIYELFDYVCGTSTGALISGLLFVKKSSLAETEKTYRELSTEVFKMNNLLGISQLFLNHAFYDCKLLEKIIRYVLECHSQCTVLYVYGLHGNLRTDMHVSVAAATLLTIGM